jgi:hypothetical protein
MTEKAVSSEQSYTSTGLKGKTFQKTDFSADFTETAER